MARTRSIKPGFFDNDIIGDLPPLTRLLFIGLWCIADREGRLQDRPRRIKKALLGYDDVDADGVDKMLQALHDAGFIYRYTVDGEQYIHVVNFSKHQNPHIKEKPSEIPPPPSESLTVEMAGGAGSEKPVHHSTTPDDTEDEQSTIQAPDLHQTNTEQAAPITVNLSPYTGNLSPTTGNPQGGETEGPGGKPSEPKKPILERRFEEFWKAYPKKVGKKAAESSWKKIKPDAELHDRIMTAIGRARVTEQWQREGGRYIPNPATWLNQGRWDDEYEEVTQPYGSNSQHFIGNGPGNTETTDAGGQKQSRFKLAWDEDDE